MLLLVRVDDRLIHGQVTEGWGGVMRPDFILVVSNKVAGSDWERKLCISALPGGIKGDVVTVEKATERINQLATDSNKNYIIFESPEDVCAVMSSGAMIARVNVGGLHSSKGKREIIDYIYVNDQDTRCLKTLVEKGIELDFRDLPQHANVDVMSLL